MVAKLKVAGVGAGYFSAFHYDAWTRMVEVDLAAVCDLDRVRAQRMAERYSIANCFDDAAQMLDVIAPDLFDIAAPSQSHMHLIRLGAERRIPMVCQKPFCLSLDEARDAVELCERVGVPLVVHDNFRFQPWYRRIRTTLIEQQVGTVYQATFRLRPGDGQGHDAYLERQPYFRTMERFLVRETAIHLIDVFRFLFGDITRVYAELARLNPGISGEDAGLILFRFADGSRGLFDGNRLADHVAQNRRLTMGEFSVEGSCGSLRLDGDGRIFLRAHGSNDWREVACEWQNRGFGGDSVHALQRHVVNFLCKDGELENSGRDYLRNLVIEEAVYRSNTAGEAIETE